MTPVKRASRDDVFIYQPLPDPHTHFRLLKIIQGGFNQHVVCELSVWPIEQAPPYVAVSYTWGDSGFTSIISLNGQHMTVRTNRKHVLQQQAHLKSASTDHLWVDAIYIDQRGLR
jgi:hypothetical protein